MPAQHRDDVRLLLLGPPGSGKGTQGTRLAQTYGSRHVSTGDLLRQQVAQGTELGRAAQPYMERGDLVPDELILAMVLDDVAGPDSPPSYVLDGFPRTVEQAEAAYEQAVATDRLLDAVICLEIDHDELVERIEQRGQRSGRADDDRETVLHRLREYEEKTAPLREYYARRGLLVLIDASGDVDEVTQRIVQAVDALPRRS